ncbi:MAG: T9SS type A sorting domain-containing protein [Flavobacteriales bacterium]|nr:T9SS type A sorting domain-containing protein [Flavobacteriales bacterium]
MKKILLSAIVAATIASPIGAQDVYIPDANFKAALVNNPTINTNSDTEIQVSEAIAYNQWISVEYKNISDMTGIEAFVNINALYCGFNSLTSLDVSQNVNLFDLRCTYNQISSLDLSSNTALTQIFVDGNPISSLDLSNCPDLTKISAGDANFTSIDISNNPSLQEIQMVNNQISVLDISNNPYLTKIDMSLNLLTSVDISNHPSMTRIFLSNNQLTELNINNGNTPNLTYMHANGNPNLTCIEVSDSLYSALNWTNGNPSQGANFSWDAGVIITENCGGVVQYTIGSSSSPSNGGSVNGAGSYDDGSSVTLTATANSGYQFVKWTENGSDISTANPYTFTASADRTITAVFESTLGISGKDNLNIVRVYPNPTKGTLNIQVKETLDIRIVNLLGETLISSTITKQNGNIDLSNLTAGVYFIQTEKGDIIKFIKE